MKKKIRWFKFFSRGQHPVLANDLFWQALIIQPKITGLPKFNFYKRDIKSTYFEKKEFKKLLYILKSQLKNKPDWLFKKLQKIEKISQSLICLAKKYNLRNWQKASNKELKSKLLFFLKRLIPLFCSAYYPLWLEQVGTELLQELFKKIKIKRNKIIWQITRPCRLTTREKFNLTLLTLTCDLKKSKNSYKKLKSRVFQNKIEKLIKNFGFLPTYLLNVKFYNKKEIEKEIKNLLLEDPCQKRREKLKLLKQQQETRKLLLKDLDSKTRKIAEVLSFDVWFRDERITWYAKIFSLIYPLFCELAKRRGITYQEFVQQTISEIKTGDVSYQELQDRLKGYTYLVKNKVVTILPYKKRKIKAAEKIKIIKGQIANPGKAKGKVRIGTAYTFHQIKPREVVVTGMTTPEAVTFCRKAAAIVTDEGGVSCHAAIISRELNIPCIIGTKIATKVLKDGDRVEVDANKGIVKILKKS